MKEILLGHISTNSGRIWCVDPRIVVCDPNNIQNTSLLLNTEGALGTFPVYHIKDNEEGGSQIVIELTPNDS